MTADRRFAGALRDLTAALDELPAASMIIGGVAVIAAGVPRQTIDIDAIVSGRAASVEDVVEALNRHAIIPRIPDAREFARDHNVLLMVHGPSAVTIELSFAWLPFEEEALSRSLIVELEDIRLRVARPEDLIVYKAAAWRDRDRADIERLLEIHIAEIDLQRVRQLIAEVASALEDPGRLPQFDAIVERVRLR